MREVRFGATDCRPEETGYDSTRLEVLHKHFDKLIDEGVINGAQYTIAHKGKIIANGAIGAGSAVEKDVLMTPDMDFGIASITKTFCALAVMKLVEDGYFRLEQKMGEFIDIFSKKPFDQINIWHMLTHTSGLFPDGGCYPEVTPKNSWQLVWEESQKLKNEGKDYKNFDWVAAGIAPGLRTPTGKEWAYCSFGFAILGELVTRVSGMRAEDYIMENIVKPLGMNESFFPDHCVPEEGAKHIENFYIRNERLLKLREEIRKGDLSGIGKEDEGDEVFSLIPCTAGGLASNTRDLATYGMMLLNHGTWNGQRIIGRKALEKMTSHQLFNIPDTCWGANEPDRGYGIGFDMRKGLPWTYSEGTFMHEGAGSCSLDMDPVEDLVAAWFVPWKDGETWNARGLYNVQNIIWSGLK
ncbi:MAG: serine hydrolase [Lachnospiraceae bacterium]|nr:serine hydrolase [Lachnospiraceae bacterium]